MRERTWNIDAVAPAFPPDIAFLADCFRICSADTDGDAFMMALLGVVVAVSALDIWAVVRMVVAAIVVMNALRDDDAVLILLLRLSLS